MNTDKRRSRKPRLKNLSVFNFRLLSVSICVYLWLIFLSSCGSKPTDLRTLIPADSLVYLESNDLGAVMKTITHRPAFREAAKTVPDFSVLNGVKLAVAVTGFETKEQPVTDEASVLNFQPRFVAILETNAWNYQALTFTEHKLGEFINSVYGGEVLLETSDKHDGKYFVWKANDGRKAYALVQGSLIFFGNDETAIEKSLAVKRGEADAISKNPKITNGDRLAFGYVSPDGVAQIANVLGVKYASEASDQPEVQNAVAMFLPQVFRNVVTDVSWTATKTEQGIEDQWLIAVPDDVARVFTESMAANPQPDPSLLTNLYNPLPSVTIYNLRDTRVALQAVLAVAQRSDLTNARIIELFGNSMFDQYGIKNIDEFLNSVGSTVITGIVDEATDQRVIVASIKDDIKLRKSLNSELKRTTVGLGNGKIGIWKADGEDLAALFEDGTLILGTMEAVLKTQNASSLGGDPSRPDVRMVAVQNRLRTSAPTTITMQIDKEIVQKLAGFFCEVRPSDERPETTTYIETHFNKKGIERKTVSDFGFFGWIITQLSKDY